MSIRKRCLRAAVVLACVFSIMLVIQQDREEVYALSDYQFVVLGTYKENMKIGDEFYLTYITSDGKKPKFSSDDSKVASVNTYGKVTAKGEGVANITARIKNGEATCKVYVEKTQIKLNMLSVSLENGSSIQLIATTSNGHEVKFKSAKRSIATVSDKGVITAVKPGVTTVTVTADKNSVLCKVNVRKPTVKLSKTSLSLYRNGTYTLTAASTSKSIPVWKSSKKSVALVDQNGKVTAVKNGTAKITVTVDGVSKTCELTVQKPVITISEKQITLNQNQTIQIKAAVSSGNHPEYSSSNEEIVTVDENGVVTAQGSGKAYVYVKEDGVKEKVTVIVQK